MGQEDPESSQPRAGTGGGGRSGRSRSFRPVQSLWWTGQTALGDQPHVSGGMIFSTVVHKYNVPPICTLLLCRVVFLICCVFYLLCGAFSFSAKYFLLLCGVVFLLFRGVRDLKEDAQQRIKTTRQGSKITRQRSKMLNIEDKCSVEKKGAQQRRKNCSSEQ